jgi:hypothetical protein
LGNVWHYVANPAPAVDGPAGEHPFCACCFLTKNFETFKPYVEDDGHHAIRFYAAHGIDAAASADCRINGDEFEPGKDSLRRYLASWPGDGIEIRKQDVFVHTLGDDGP